MSAAGAIVLEHVAFEALERDGDEKPRRNDAVRVDVVAAERQCAARGLLDAAGPRAHAITSLAATCRTSTTSPASAAAATIAGDISSVRPVGLP